MRTFLQHLSPILRLTRVTSAFAAVGNTWFVILWTLASPEEPGTRALGNLSLGWALFAGAVVGLGLYAYGAALNDILDVRRDRALHSQRPLPSGRLSIDAAVGLVACTLMGAVLGASLLGVSAVLLCILTAAAILFFNSAARFVPSIGVVALGLIYAGHMLAPNVSLRFLWPVWMVMTHALIIGAATHVVSERTPRLSGRAVVAAVTGWAFWSAVLLWLGHERTGALWPEWVKPQAIIGPILCAFAFAAFAVRKLRIVGKGPRAAEKIARYGALWLALYNTTWLLGQGYLGESAILAAFTLAAFLGMTVIREGYAALEQPLTYRR